MQTLHAQFGDTDGNLNVDSTTLFDAISKALPTETAKPKARRTKVAKDPNKPKHPKSAYFIWSDTERGPARSFLQESAEPDHKVSVGEVAKELSKRWKLLSTEDKAPFDVQAKEGQAVYAEKIAVYREENGIVGPVQCCSPLPQSARFPHFFI